MENAGYKSDEEFKNEYLEKMREWLSRLPSSNASIISRHLSFATSFTRFMSTRQNDRSVIVDEFIIGSIDNHMLFGYDSFDNGFQSKIVDLILTALMFPSLMGNKPVIDIHLLYSNGLSRRRETLDMFNRITENSFIENKIFTGIFNGLLRYFPADKLLEVLNMENRMVLIRFINEHSGDSVPMKL